ncbi:MAG: DUF3987 domain-containing protein [Alphaproteobacteria bacterium]|nr:DUF3987 domain-containing protein [Alphaproteobacteria bacterium]
MPLDELDNPFQPTADWPPLDGSLLGEARPTLPIFPLHVLPGRWRTWVDASSRLFGSADYLAHCLLGGVASVGGAGIRIEVASHWREPLLLWQALVGGPSSGRSAAFARVCALLAAGGPGQERPVEEGGDLVAPEVLFDAGLHRVCSTLSGEVCGVLLWREDLAEWMEEASQRPARSAWLAAWNAASAMIDDWPKPCYSLVVAGALSPGYTGADSTLASRFLYVWPARGAAASLTDADADDAGIVALLQRIAALASHREQPCVVPFDAGAARRLEALMQAIRQRTDAAEEEGLGDAAVEWIGRGVATVVRLAGVLSLMEWAESGAEGLPVGVRHIKAAHELWSAYHLPHALAVFDRAGARPGDQAARRVVRWLGRVRVPQISREDVRREALCQSVDAAGAEEVLARLEAGGVLRPLPATGSTRGGPRRRRWEVNPAVSAVGAGALSYGPRASGSLMRRAGGSRSGRP